MQSSHQSIGIVGAGAAGLYAALLLQSAGHRVKIFEGTGRVGGRIRTERFSFERHQYFEAGAMRIPDSTFHAITFDLIRYVQDAAISEDRQINLIPYNIGAPGNRLRINGVHGDGQHASAATPASIGWRVPEEYNARTAADLMWQAIGKFVVEMEADFDAGFASLLKYDNLSFRYYLLSVASLPESVIDFMETVLSQTNQFSLGSCTEMVMQYMDFNTKDWWTIDDGMDRLPTAMAHLVGYENITFGARVCGLTTEADGRVTISTLGLNGVTRSTFDKVVMAIPPSALKMIPDRPRWNHKKELAIRSMHYEPLYKMGLRFKTRFWERVEKRSTRGGQTTTDLPIRWIVYPSNGIDTDGPGVLLIYAWMTDAAGWLPLTQDERKNLALRGISQEYQGERDVDGSIIDVYDLLIDASDYAWSTDTATGDAMFLPGQFKRDFEVARRNEGNIYFAGEHLSRHHTWISGALDSALWTVSKMLDQPVKPLAGHGLSHLSPLAAPMLLVNGSPDEVRWTYKEVVHVYRSGDESDGSDMDVRHGHRGWKQVKKVRRITRSSERSLSLKRKYLEDIEEPFRF
ncbi:amine oxidase [Auriscalpium vulgare]|uniref:Amine oxidase n=1 Tax=Auriscalpium vulgare TaxID=40419 RepID=A0ACB8S595_9AGAM|nr:amine oxidase [Auriscalpium vulgare]